MKREYYIITMNELSASESVFTSGQAARLGITRKSLSQATAAGRAERIAHGAYRLAGTPTSEYDELAAIWKLTAPSSFTHERIANWDGVVVGGTSAAAMHGIGDFWLSPYRIYAPKRINSRLESVHFTKRDIDVRDVDWMHGIPVTKLERTLVDLCLDFEDPSLIEKALEDATGKGLKYDRLAELVGKQSKRSNAAPLLADLSKAASRLRGEM